MVSEGKIGHKFHSSKEMRSLRKEQGAGLGHTSRPRQGTESEPFLFFLMKTDDLKQETARDCWVLHSCPKANPFFNFPTNFQTHLCILGANPPPPASLPAETSPWICTMIPTFPFPRLRLMWSSSSWRQPLRAAGGWSARSPPRCPQGPQPAPGHRPQSLSAPTWGWNLRL